MSRWLFENFEQGVGGFLHEAGCGEDEDLLRGFAGQVVGALDEGADLAEFDEELRRVGRDDEDVGVGLDEDAGVLLVGLAKLFAGGYGFVYLLFEIGGGGDAGAVVADAAEAGEGLAVGPEIAGLALALDRHGEHEGKGVFACSGGAGEDEGVGESVPAAMAVRRCSTAAELPRNSLKVAGRAISLVSPFCRVSGWSGGTPPLG